METRSASFGNHGNSVRTLCILSAGLALLAFVANDRTPFGSPLSLVVRGPLPWLYHLVLLSLSLTLIVRYSPVLRAGRLVDMVLPATVLALLLLLIPLDVGRQPIHDVLATLLLLAAALFLWCETRRLGGPMTRRLSCLPFLAVPVLFSDSLQALGIAEGIIIGSCLGVLLLDPAVRVDMDSMRALRSSGGYLWAVFCAATAGLAGAYEASAGLGILHLAICWVAWPVAARFERGSMAELAILGSVGAGYPLVLDATTRLPLTATLIPFFAVVLVLAMRWLHSGVTSGVICE